MTSTTPFQAADAAPPSRWTARDGAAHYGLPGWGAGYFDADDAGRVVVRPDQRPDRSAALDDVLAELARRGVTPPILIRFPQILEHRAGVIRGAFDRAISDAGYRGRYTCVYPVKVNQHRGVLERISALAPALGLGLEAGSKAELIAVLAATADTPGTPIICNGFKDDECLDLIVLAAAMGRPITPIIERRAELDAALRLSDARRVDVALGLRLKLASPGAGRWQASGGLGSKFGLFVAEAADAARDLIHAGLGRRLTVLHSHIGSQIADLGAVRRAARELARVAVELRRLGASITTLDLGGGLGVDYDGGADGPTSIGYTADEYARALVDETRAVFDDAGEPHPDLITESGRALVAHESVLVTDVVGVSAHAPAPTGPDIAGAGASTLAPLRDLARLAERPPGDDPAGALRRALDARDALTGAFTAGRANLADRALGDRLFRVAGLSAVDALTRTGADPPDADRLADLLFDLYFCNFSIFQSLPDLWALGQRFPACPLTRLDERPTRRAVLCDMTCDSDGEMRSFPGPAGVGGGLMLHEPRPGAPYRVGVFLVGAYQEILGDLHNLFGDPGAAHVTIDDAGRAVIEEVIPGDSADDALRLVGHDTAAIRERLFAEADRARAAGRADGATARAYRERLASALAGSTYLTPGPGRCS